MAGKADRVGLGALFWSFAKMGAVLIGGGYALLPLLEREVVARRRWATSGEMLDLYALAQLLPGIIAVNTSMLVGNRLRGFAGTLAAAAGLTAAPFLMIAAYAAAYGTLRDTSLFARALSGVQPAVAGMILGLGADMIRKNAECRVKNERNDRSVDSASRRVNGQEASDARAIEQSNNRTIDKSHSSFLRRWPLLLAMGTALVVLLFNPSFAWLILFSLLLGLALHLVDFLPHPPSPNATPSNPQPPAPNP